MKISKKIFIAKMAFVLVCAHQIHAMEEGAEGNDKEGMELLCLSPLIQASRSVDGDSEGEEYEIGKLIKAMNLELADAAESGPRQADEIRQGIINKLKSDHSQDVCDGTLDAVLCQLSRHLLCKEQTGNVGDNNVSPTLSVSLCSRSYSKPYQKIVEIKTEGGKVRASILPRARGGSAIRIQRLDCDEENVDIQTFKIDKECSCLALNALQTCVAYVKKDDGIFYRDLRGDTRETQAQEVTGDSWVAVLALSPSGEKLAYCLAKKMSGNYSSGGAYTYTGSDEAFVYDIPSKTLIKLDRYDVMAANPCHVFTLIGLPVIVAVGSIGAAVGAFFGYVTAPDYCNGKQLEEDWVSCTGEFEKDFGDEKTRLGAWVGAVAGSSLGMLIYLCSLPCNPVCGDCYFRRNISPIGFADDDTVQAQYRYTMHAWDVSMGDVAIEEFKKECYLEQISDLGNMGIEDVDKSTDKLVRTLLSSPMRALLSDDEKKKTKRDIKEQAERLCLDDLV